MKDYNEAKMKFGREKGSDTSEQVSEKGSIPFPFSLFMIWFLVIVSFSFALSEDTNDTRLYQYLTSLTNTNMQKGIQPEYVIIDGDQEEENWTILWFCETAIRLDCNLTDHSKCKDMTVPPKCDTSEAQNCLTKGQCTKHEGCQKVSLAPACRTSSHRNPEPCLTDAKGCYTFGECTVRVGVDGCYGMTIYPACETKSKCLTFFKDCTNNAFCKIMTLPPKCQTNENDLCRLTWKKDCQQTANDYNCINTRRGCYTEIKDVTCGGGYNCTKTPACDKTVQVRCLTKPGLICKEQQSAMGLFESFLSLVIVVAFMLMARLSWNINERRRCS